MAQPSSLQEYRRKRDFHLTSEPKGSKPKNSKGSARFVIQQHDASRMHFDLRLEMDGVLKSWAVPKGPSLNPKDKRLAMPTEDHPLEYVDFEGTIPEGEYGGGTVMVWDIGTYENRSVDAGKRIEPGEAVRKGHLKIELRGEKLKGGFALIRTSQGDERERWLLIKERDDAADARRKPAKTQSRSALTGRGLKEIAAGEN